MVPDPTFYPSPKMAVQAPKENYTFIAMFNPDASRPDGITVIDLSPESESYWEVVHRLIVPYKGDEFVILDGMAVNMRCHL